MNFRSLCLAAVMTVSASAFSAENLIKQEGAWKHTVVDADLSRQEGTRVFRISKNRAWIWGPDRITIDPAKTYTISMDLKNADGKPVNPMNYIGIAMLDSKQRVLTRDFVRIVPGSFATVAADAPKGAQEVTVNGELDLAKELRSVVGLILNAREDLSDLPNRNFAGQVLKTAVADGKTVLTLKKPLARDLKAGEKVRCQYMASGYSYGILAGRIPGYDWKTYSCKVSGTDLQGTGAYNKFWPGASIFQVVIVANYNPKTASEILVKNISVTAE